MGHTVVILKNLTENNIISRFFCPVSLVFHDGYKYATLEILR